MIKLATAFAALTLLLPAVTPAAKAQPVGPFQNPTGTWYFFLTLDGQPPCQCTEITRFNLDGTLNGPANDHFSGDYIGIWQEGPNRIVSVVLAQNNINPDGSAGGVYITKFSMSMGANGFTSTGTGSIQLLDNGGNVVFSDTFSFKGTKLRLP